MWLAVTLATGRTVGDLAVELRYRGGPVPEPLARPLRFAGGIGGYLLLGLLPGGWTFTQLLFAAASVVLVFTTDAARGLPGLVSGQRVTDARGEAPVGDRGEAPVTDSGAKPL